MLVIERLENEMIMELHGGNCMPEDWVEGTPV